MDSQYLPKEHETGIYDFWTKKGLFHSVRNQKEPFVIVIPPPNITGSLHMGHALNNTLQDILIRNNRLNGKNTLWMPGTDHGGIATQNVLEKELRKEKITRHELGREKFLSRMKTWANDTKITIMMQLRRLGCSLDWERERFTMDDTCSAAVMTAFESLYKSGHIYRGKRMVNWCPRCYSALSDLEVEYQEENASLYYIRYPYKDGPSRYVVVATTRPETMLGDTAVAFNPEDERYLRDKGKILILPLAKREIPLIADSYVDREFGTGLVKITPAHDLNDNEVSQRHDIGSVTVINDHGKMTKDAGTVYEGLDRMDARKKILKDLEEQGLLDKVEPYKLKASKCYRCATMIEPLEKEQWFVKMKELTSVAINATEKDEVTFFPSGWKKPFLLWLGNIHDWCISRQIWWGHQIPVWYCASCLKDKIHITKENISMDEAVRQGAYFIEGITEKDKGVTVSEKKPANCNACGKTEFVRDPDVLDTWFSSALWPFSTFGWQGNGSGDLEYYYPTSTLVTGHEILYLWVARMVMAGLHFMKKVPFTKVFLHGIVRDSHGKKMSKSLGNVIDPLTVMEEYGTDALRFSLAKQSIPGRDLTLSAENFAAARNFMNKIWNSSRFIIMRLAEKRESLPEWTFYDLSDRWIYAELYSASAEIRTAYEDYEIARAARAGYEFIWHKYCDWYIEMSKEELDKKQDNLLYLLTRILKLTHPVTPFITEEIWQRLRDFLPLEESIMDASFDTEQEKPFFNEARKKMNLIIEIISALRALRMETDIKPKDKINAIISLIPLSFPLKKGEEGVVNSQHSFLEKGDGGVVLPAGVVPPGTPAGVVDTDDKISKDLNNNASYIKTLGKVENLGIGVSIKRPAKHIVFNGAGFDIYMPFTGEKKEIESLLSRFEKTVEKDTAMVSHLEQKLKNPKFIEHAPEEAKLSEERLSLTKSKITRLKFNIDILKTL